MPMALTHRPIQRHIYDVHCSILCGGRVLETIFGEEGFFFLKAVVHHEADRLEIHRTSMNRKVIKMKWDVWQKTFV